MTGKIGRAARGLIVVGLFAIAMAYVEAAVVVYLRAMYGIDDLLRDMPLRPDRYTPIEIGREAATLVMLAVIGWATGRRWQDRIGYAAFAFGLWDIFYYGWLVIFIGWPRTLLDWDVLFFIPLPWWGPVLSPMLIALLLVVGGALAVIKAERGGAMRFAFLEWGMAGASVLLALSVFTTDALRALPGGVEAVNRARPAEFNWLLFLVALAGMAYSLLRGLRSGAGGQD